MGSPIIPSTMSDIAESYSVYQCKNSGITFNAIIGILKDGQWNKYSNIFLLANELNLKNSIKIWDAGDTKNVVLLNESPWKTTIDTQVRYNFEWSGGSPTIFLTDLHVNDPTFNISVMPFIILYSTDFSKIYLLRSMNASMLPENTTETFFYGTIVNEPTSKSLGSVNRFINRYTDNTGVHILDVDFFNFEIKNVSSDKQLYQNIINWVKTGKEIDTYDPNNGGGDSKPSGGGGPSDIGGDTNSDDGLPTISALDSGLLTAYNPTVAELQSLGKFLWSDGFDVNSFKKLFNDPFDTLLGLSIVPIKPTTSGSRNIMFGNLDSGVSAPVVSDQWISKDMGSVVLKEVWKGALDYSPSTSASIYLPYIGMRQLNINDVMGSTIHLIYKFDVLTGTCIAQLYVNHDHMGNKDDGFDWNPDQGLLYEFMGQCSVNIPLASQDFTNTIRSAVSAVGMVAGASASIATGNPVLGVATATVASANLGMQANTPTVERSGHLSSAGSLLGYYRPFLVVTRPHQCKPKRYYSLRGVPSQVYTDKLSNCTGFTQITANNNIHVSGAEDSELAEIQNLLVSGVYFPDNKR